MRLPLLAALLAGLAAAPAQLPIESPLLGYVWDADSRRLRPILGIPGSSLLGSPLDTGVPLALAEISPRHDYALGVSAETGAVLLLRFEPNRAVPAALAGLPPGADRIAVSPRGAAAVLYSHGRPALHLLTGLPDAPAVSSLALPGPPGVLAVSDLEGRVLAVSAGELYALAPDAGPRALGPVDDHAALAFVENSTQALVADPGRREVFLLDEDGARRPLAGEREGVRRPVAVAWFHGRALVADAASSSVLALDPAGGAPAAIQCPCAVSTLQPLAGGAFRLSSSIRSAAYLLEAGPDGPRIWFVPADAGPPLPPRGRIRP